MKTYTKEDIELLIEMIKSEYATSQSNSFEGAHHSDWLDADSGFEILLKMLTYE